MLYRKPELKVLANSLDAIRGGCTHKDILGMDTNSTTHVTPSAYEADE